MFQGVWFVETRYHATVKPHRQYSLVPLRLPHTFCMVCTFDEPLSFLGLLLERGSFSTLIIFDFISRNKLYFSWYVQVSLGSDH